MGAGRREQDTSYHIDSIRERRDKTRPLVPLQVRATKSDAGEARTLPAPQELRFLGCGWGGGGGWHSAPGLRPPPTLGLPTWALLGLRPRSLRNPRPSVLGSFSGGVARQPLFFLSQ